MKKLTSLLAVLVFASFFIFTSCGGKEKPGPSNEDNAQETAANNLKGTWKVESVKRNNEDSEADWTGFTLSLTGSKDGGNFTAAGIPAGYEKVWSNGTWKFADATTTTKIIGTREDGVSVNLNLASASSLTAEFTIAEDAASRAQGITGSWKVTFKK